jgi:hypothetical protein
MEDKILIKSPVPLDMEQIKNLYTNKDKVQFLLDYKKSQIRDRGFLFYVGNLEIPGDVLLDVPSEEKLSLVREYMILPNLVNLNTLVLAVMQIVLIRKGADVSDMFSATALTKDEANIFIEQNTELVDKWIVFIDSLYVFALYCAYMNDTIGDSVDENIIREKSKNNPIRHMVTECMDPTYISPNFIYLIQTPMFLQTYFSLGIDLNKTRFFTFQFTEYCYKGMNLFYHFVEKDNWLLAAVTVILGQNGDISEEPSDDKTPNN